jgi:hypothetical protein
VDKTWTKPRHNLDIDIDIDNDIDIELILFPKVNNIFRNYVLRSIIRGSEALRGGAGTWNIGTKSRKGIGYWGVSLWTRDLDLLYGDLVHRHRNPIPV